VVKLQASGFRKDSREYSAAPIAALESTKVDFSLPVAEIGPKLVELVGDRQRTQARVGFRDEGMKRTCQTYSCAEGYAVLEEVEEGELYLFAAASATFTLRKVCTQTRIWWSKKPCGR